MAEVVVLYGRCLKVGRGAEQTSVRKFFQRLTVVSREGGESVARYAPD